MTTYGHTPRKDNGDWISSSFSEVNDEEYVPLWLQSMLKDRIMICPDLYIWEEDIAWQIGILVAPYISTPEEVNIFAGLLGGQELQALKSAMAQATHQYANGFKAAFLQEQARRRRLKSSCALCHAQERLPGHEVCTHCRKEHWKEEQRLNNQLYRARKAKAPATLTLVQWVRTLKRYGYCCSYCQTAPFEIMEHYIPLPHGGTTEENCVPACRPCNLKKRNDHPEKL